MKSPLRYVRYRRLGHEDAVMKDPASVHRYQPA